MKLRKLSGLAVATLLLAAACQPGTEPATPGPATPEPGVPTPANGEPTPANGEPTPAAERTAQPADQAPTDELGVVSIPAGDPLHIGFWGVLSGANTTLGVDSQRGLEIAIDDVGGRWLGREIQVTIEDGLCSTAGGNTAATRMTSDPTIVGMVGSSCSDETVGGIDIITDAGYTTISPANTRPALTEPDRGPEYAGYLRTAHSDAVQGAAAAEFAYTELGLRSAATVHDGSAYAEALQGVFADEFAALGGEVCLQTAVSVGQSDMVPVLTTIASSCQGGAAPEIIFYPLFVDEAAFFTLQSADVPGLENIVLMGADAAFTPTFRDQAGGPALGMYLSSPDFTAFGPAYGEFLDKHQEKYGEDVVSIFHAHSYDATNILLNAIAEVAVETPDGTLHVPRGALREAMFATANHEGIIGTITCDEYGDCSAPIIGVYEISQREIDGEWPPEAPIWRFGEE